MALSNIFKEPRREIMETVVGAGAVAAFFVADYFVVRWLGATAIGDTIFGMAMMVPILFILVGALFLIHELGDGICNALQRRGIHLRPRLRK